jgi:hypothetical protein
VGEGNVAGESVGEGEGVGRGCWRDREGRESLLSGRQQGIALVGYKRNDVP